MQTQKIIKVRKIGKIRTKDIEVNSKKHLFYANNIAVSNSHSVVYAQHGYVSAYAKAHYPKDFFAEYLRQAKHRGAKKEQEKRQLIQDARKHGISVQLFNINHDNKEYDIVDDEIHVGFIDMKYCGEGDWAIWQKWKATNKVPQSWDEFLVYASDNFNFQCMNSLIMGGALDSYRVSRKKMQYQYNLWKRLGTRQVLYIRENYFGSILSCLNAIISLGSGKGKPCHDKRAIAKVESIIKDWSIEAYNTWTTAGEIERVEVDIIGAPITCTRFDESDSSYISNITCLDLSNVAPDYNSQYKVLCSLNDIRVIKTKKDKKEMAFVSFSDGMYEIEDGVIFPEAFQEYKHNLIEDIEVLLVIKKNKPSSYVIEKIIEV